MAAPPGTPTALVEKINRDTAAILKKPEVVEKFQSLRLDVMGGSTADAVKFIGDETRLWGRVIKEANITVP